MKHYCTLLFICISIFSIYAQQKTIYEFEKMMPQWQKQYNVPAVGIGIIEDGQVIYTNVFGEQKTGIPANDQTIFTVASLTKPIFAMVALNLVEKGDLQLDESISAYHIDPDVKEDKRLTKLNARFVLSHQSGFVNWRNMSPSKKLEFNFTPGDQYLYSGEGYEYLRRAIENKTGKDLPTLAEELLFKPLDLNNIAFTWNTSWDINKVAIPHNKNLETYEYAPRTELNAAAGLLTTIEDYTKVCAYTLNGGGLSTALFNEMISPQVTVKENLFYGLGWEVIPALSNKERVIMHSGDENGIKTFTVLIPSSKRGMVIFTNADEGYKVYDHIVKSYLPEGAEIFEIKNKKIIPQAKYEIPAQDIVKYTGTYQIKENVTFSIEENNEKLDLIIPGQSPYKLIAQSEKEFVVNEELKLEFVKNSQNQFTSVILYQYGVKSYEGTKIE